MNDSPAIIIIADLERPDHQAWTLHLVDSYSRDPMGDGEPLAETSRSALIAGLREHPTTVVFIAVRDGAPAGIAVCFRGFSTFAARPLINIHDFFVAPGLRGQGIGRLIFEAVEEHARSIGCCGLTLEVQENNHRARSIYAAAGFAQAVHRPEAGGALFLTRRF